MDTLAHDRERLEIPRRSRWEYAARAGSSMASLKPTIVKLLREYVVRSTVVWPGPACRPALPAEGGRAHWAKPGSPLKGHTFGGELWRGLTLKVALHPAPSRPH